MIFSFSYSKIFIVIKVFIVEHALKILVETASWLDIKTKTIVHEHSVYVEYAPYRYIGSQKWYNFKRWSTNLSWYYVKFEFLLTKQIRWFVNHLYFKLFHNFFFLTWNQNWQTKIFIFKFKSFQCHKSFIIERYWRKLLSKGIDGNYKVIGCQN